MPTSEQLIVGPVLLCTDEQPVVSRTAVRSSCCSSRRTTEHSPKALPGATRTVSKALPVSSSMTVISSVLVPEFAIRLLAVGVDHPLAVVLERGVHGDVGRGQRHVAILEDLVRLGQAGDTHPTENNRRGIELDHTDHATDVDDGHVLLTILLGVLVLVQLARPPLATARSFVGLCASTSSSLRVARQARTVEPTMLAIPTPNKIVGEFLRLKNAFSATFRLIAAGTNFIESPY